MSAPICVTGANGYIAGWIIELLLQGGYTVHGTLRNPDDPKNDFLKEIAVANNAEKRLRLFKADLQQAGSFHAAIEGCDVVIHTAAVVTLDAKNPQKDMIEPTLAGVRNVIAACVAHHVKKVVYTSSVATITCAEVKRPLEDRGKPFTEDMWLQNVDIRYAPYNYMKIEAEKLIKELWKGPMVSILPSWTLGPQQNTNVTSSQKIVELLLKRRYGKAVPPLYFDCVDVRDVARAHIFAATSDVLRCERYTVSGNMNIPLSHVAALINAQFPKLNLGTKQIPWVGLWIASWFDKRIAPITLYEKSTPHSPLDNSKIRAAGFQYQYTILSQTLRDSVLSFKRQRIVADPTGAIF